MLKWRGGLAAAEAGLGVVWCGGQDRGMVAEVVTRIALWEGGETYGDSFIGL